MHSNNTFSHITSWNTVYVKNCDTLAKRFTWPAYSISCKGQQSVLRVKETLWENNFNLVRDTSWGTWRRAHLPGSLKAGWSGLWGWSISLWRGYGEGDAGGGCSFTGDPEMYVKKVSGCRHLFPWEPLSIRGEPGMCGGGSYTRDFDRWMNGGL
jgi:hypothetical protein